ncbi:MAG TPA: universal stress protein [Gemmatimonadales bacterium]|nr:universal stress protein [Gemmatimonadales bacterium]
MYRSILLPLDGSALAERAIPLAAGLAAASGALLHVVVVHKWLASWSPVNPFALTLDEIDAQARREKEAYLQRVADDIAQHYDLTVRPAMPEGFTVEQLAQYVRANGVDLVVMTTHGRGGFSRHWFGSVADRLLRTLTVPVLLCRAGPAGAPEPAVPFRRILVSLDGSTLAETALAAAEPLARMAGDGRLHLCMVVEPAHLFLPAVAVSGGLLEELGEAERREYAAAYLQLLALRLARRSVTAETSVVAGDDPAAAILEMAERVGADLIALATRGRGGAARAVFGSVADKVMRTAQVPVLVTHPSPRAARLAPAYSRAIEQRRRDTAADATASAAGAR